MVPTGQVSNLAKLCNEHSWALEKAGLLWSDYGSSCLLMWLHGSHSEEQSWSRQGGLGSGAW